MRLLVVSVTLLMTPALALGQQRGSPEARPRSFSLVAGVGNAMGWLGFQGEKYLRQDRLSAFAGLGYTPAVDQGDASGASAAIGVRGYTPGRRHRGFLELSLSQLFVQGACFDDCRRLYGPGVQGGYQFTASGGFTLAVSLGVGYAPGAPAGEAKAAGMIGVGLGYTWRR